MRLSIRARVDARVWLLVTMLGALVGAAGCADFSREAALKGLSATETVCYWTVRGEFEGEIYIRPTVRFRIRNQGEREVDHLRIMAVFRRESAPQDSWGNAFDYAPLSGEPIPAGGVSGLITLRSDSYYFSKRDPKKMFDNSEWEQVTVEVFLKVGRSSWKSVAMLEVPKRLGAPGVEKFTEPNG